MTNSMELLPPSPNPPPPLPLITDAASTAPTLSSVEPLPPLVPLPDPSSASLPAGREEGKDNGNSGGCSQPGKGGTVVKPRTRKKTKGEGGRGASEGRVGVGGGNQEESTLPVHSAKNGGEER